MVSEDGDLVVAEIQRRGEVLGDDQVELAVGDVLLLRGSWEALEARADDPGFLVVDHPDLVRRQAVPLGLRAREAILAWWAWSCCS